jgi:hypothetical protein
MSILNIIGYIIIASIIVAVSYFVYNIVIVSMKDRKKKKEYIQKIKMNIYYINMLENCPPFIVLPDDYLVNIQDCLYKIADLNVDDILRDEMIRSFMMNYKNIEENNYKNWHQYIAVL